MEENKRITIRDIAKTTGFSHATVSRVLNKKGKFYSEKTSKKIEKVANELGYIPNALARYLKYKKTRIIAYLIPLSHHFYFSIYRGIRRTADNEGYNVLIMDSDTEKELEEKNINTLLENRVDGIIIASSLVNNKQIIRLKKHNIPIVLVDREKTSMDVSTISINNEEISFLATNYLIRCGYNKICYFSGPLNIINYKKRFLGYKKALEKNNIKLDSSNIILMKGLKWLDHYESDYRLIKEFISEKGKNTALFITSEILPIIAVNLINQLSLKIPDDIGILGFGETPLSKYIYPSISSIVLPAEEMGIKAMEVILKMINNNNKKETIELKAKIKIRDSLLKKSFRLIQKIGRE